MSEREKAGGRTRTGRAIAAEAGTMARFGLVGIAATAVHTLIALVLTATDMAHPLVANLIAFLTAFTVSFLGHHLWSFRGGRRWARRMIRFLAIALAGLAANSTALAGWLAWVPLPEELGIVVTVALIPLVSYLGARFWAFSDGAPQGRD